MAIYPNRGIVDCGFSIVRGGEQHAFHASRRAGDPSDTTGGPFKIEIQEPMRCVRVAIDENETGIACDLVFDARTACIEEGRQTTRVNNRLMMDATRFGECGRGRGETRYGGRPLPVEAARVYGTKDRSWGIRPVGEPEAGGAADPGPPPPAFPWGATSRAE